MSRSLTAVKSTREVARKASKPAVSIAATLYNLLAIIVVFLVTLVSMLTWKRLRGHTVKNGAKRKNNMNWYYHQWMRRIILTVNPFWKRKVYFDVPSKELKKNTYLYMCNHTSYADFIMLSGVEDLNYVGVGKSDLLHIPIIGHVFQNNGFLPVEFEKKPDGKWGTKKGSTEKLMKWAKKDLLNGISIILFPEGQITMDYELEKFKPGFFRLAIETDTPVVPVATWGNQKMWPMVKKAIPARRMRSGNSYVRFGAPMEPLHPTEVSGDDALEISQFLTAKYDLTDAEIQDENIQVIVQALSSYNADEDGKDEGELMNLTVSLYTELVRRRVLSLRYDLEEQERKDKETEYRETAKMNKYYAEVLDSALQLRI